MAGKAEDELIYEALRFLVWAAGEGISPVDGEPAESPEEVLFRYACTTGFEDYDAIPAAIAWNRRPRTPADNVNGDVA